MKKIFIKMFVMALMFVGSIAVVSCQKSTEQLLDQYEEVCKKAGKAINDGNIISLDKLAKEGNDIEKELSKRELTPEEQQRYLKLQAELAQELGNKMSGALDDVMSGMDFEE